jgi:hypothetical protein
MTATDTVLDFRRLAVEPRVGGPWRAAPWRAALPVASWVRENAGDLVASGWRFGWTAAGADPMPPLHRVVDAP